MPSSTKSTLARSALVATPAGVPLRSFKRPLNAGNQRFLEARGHHLAEQPLLRRLVRRHLLFAEILLRRNRGRFRHCACHTFSAAWPHRSRCQSEDYRSASDSRRTGFESTITPSMSKMSARLGWISHTSVLTSLTIQPIQVIRGARHHRKRHHLGNLVAVRFFQARFARHRIEGGRT